MEVEDAFSLVAMELDTAQDKFPSFNNYHEGYAVILEELDELWLEIKGKQQRPKLIEEAKQTAAMAIRFLIDCC